MSKNILVRLLVLFVVMTVAGGCFWYSPAPNFHKDKLKEVTVIWDRLAPDGMVEKVTWTTTDATELAKLTDALDMKSWESLSVLIVGDTTRVGLYTAGGDHWEMGVYGYEDPKRLSLFNRIDTGMSGVIRKPENFLKCLTETIQAHKDFKVDLMKYYGSQLYERTLQRRITEEAKQQMPKFYSYH